MWGRWSTLNTIGQLRWLCPCTFFTAACLRLLPREELGAGKNQWTCSHNDSVPVCSGMPAIWRDDVVGQQRNALFRWVNSWKGLWPQREDLCNSVQYHTSQRNAEPIWTVGIMEYFQMTTLFYGLTALTWYFYLLYI